MVNNDLVLFSGYAKLPIGITATEIYKVIGVVVLINMDTGVIVDVDCTLATDLARMHMKRALTGYNLNEGCDSIQQLIEHIYQGSAKKAIITAIRIIYDKYRNYKIEAAPASAGE